MLPPAEGPGAGAPGLPGPPAPPRGLGLPAERPSAGAEAVSAKSLNKMDKSDTENINDEKPRLD